jgi:hypothetical protein
MTKLEAADLAAARSLSDLGTVPAAAIAACRTAPDALRRLGEAGFLIEATRLMAHALPRREAVWWACMCAQHTAPAALAAADKEAREAAEQWVRKQDDQWRRKAMARARDGQFQSPESWAAAAAFFAGDSLTEPDQPKVAPAPHLTGAAVAGAIALAAVREHPERQAARLQRFLDGGRDIAGGGSGRLPAEEG